MKLSNALACGIAAAILFALMGTFVHATAGKVPSTQLLFVRAIGGAVFLSFLVRPNLRSILSFHALRLWIRGVFGACGIACYFWSLQRLNVAAATLLADTVPIFMLALLSLNRRKWPSGNECISVVVASTGIALMSGANFDLQSLLPVAVGLSGALFGALAYISLHSASQTHRTGEIVLVLSVCMAILGLLLPSSDWVAFDSETVLPAGAVVVLSLGAQVLTTKSFRGLPPVTASIVGLSATFWGLVFECALENRLPSLTAGAGMAVAASGLAMLVSSRTSS